MKKIDYKKVAKEVINPPRFPNPFPQPPEMCSQYKNANNIIPS